MVQDQLVDYVSSQIKLGVSRDAIKSALVSAGWVAADVDDTLKKVVGGAQPAAPGGPAQPLSSSFPSSSPAAIGSYDKSQMIRVTDLVSGSPSPIASVSTKPSTFVSKPVIQSPGRISGNTFQATPAVAAGGSSSGGSGSSGGDSKKALIGGIVAAILILVCAGAALYFYSMNASLASKVASLTSESATVNAQLASLQSQVGASSTGFAGQLASLTATNAELALNLSFYAVSVGNPSSTVGTPLPITISGSLSGGGKAPYAATTPLGAKIFIANSSDVTIGAQLKTLVGQTVTLTGMYVPGSDQMTVTSVQQS